MKILDELYVFEFFTRLNNAELFGDIKPEWALYYAQALANKQQYQASEQWYSKYLQLTTDSKVAASFVKAYSHIDDFLKNHADWKIEYLNINTAGAEYSPTYYKNGMIFVSNRRTPGIVKNVFEWDKTPYSDLYFVERSKIKGIDPDSIMDVLRKEIKASGRKLYKENDDDTEPTSNDSRIVGSYNLKLLRDTLGDYLAAQVDAQPLQGAINSKYHEGPAAVLPGGSVMFTRNNYIKKKYAESKDGINKLQLYVAKAPDFGTIESFAYNNDQYSVGHPALNKLGTLLIFTSDMPGGFGGTDLYYSTRATVTDKWSKPVNMGPVINTAGNEMFPAMYKDSVLLFSSTGHAGLGGLDIFQVALDGVTPLHTPVNLGAPINSSVDDFGIIRNDDGKSGYFTSNRKGSDDIYSFKYIAYTIKVKGVVVDSLTGRFIENAVVTIGNDNQTSETGSFEAQLSKATDYKITAAKDGYTNCTNAFVSTKGITSDTTLNVVLKLCKIIPKPEPVLAVKPVEIKPLNCDSLKDLVAVRKIYYDLDKSAIRPDSHTELDNLIKVLKSHPQLKVILASHCDSRASSKYNDALSMRRSISSRAYLLKNGISLARMKIEAYGKSRLANNCPDGVKCTEADQQLNRRTEFILVKDGMELQDINCNVLLNAVKK